MKLAAHSGWRRVSGQGGSGRGSFATADLISLKPTAEQTLMSASCKQGSRLPPEYWITAGIALAASGHFNVFAAIVAIYFILKRARPDMESDLLMIASGFWGAAIVEAFKILVWGRNPNLIWEQVVVTGAATMLANTRNRGWARFLQIYCIFGALFFLAIAILGQKQPGAQKFAFARAALYLLGLWLTTRWLRRQQRSAAKTKESQFSEVEGG